MRALLHALEIAIGGLFLALVAPHASPADPTLLAWGGLGTPLEIGPLGPLGSVGPWTLRVPAGVASAALALIAAALVLVAGKRLGPGDPAAGTGSGRRSAALALVLLTTLFPTTRGAEVVAELVLASAGVALVAHGLCGLAPNATEALSRRAALLVRGATSRPRYLQAAVPVATGLVALLASHLIFGGIPHVVDAVDQLFHGRILMGGRVAAPAPEPAAAFQLTHMISDGSWYSQYPPGHSLLLGLGASVGAPWLVGPLFGALSVALVFLLGRELYDERTARTAAVLGLASPFVLLMSSSHMNHGTSLFFLLALLLGLARMVRRGGWGNALLTGFAGGYALTIRPLTAAAFLLPAAALAVARLVRLARGRETNGAASARSWAVSCFLALAAFAIPAGALLLFNLATNGAPFLSGFEVLHGPGALPGFGNAGWGDAPHTPLLGLRSTLENLNALNQYLFGLPLPSLALPILGLAAVRARGWDTFLVVCVAALGLAYWFYWFNDWTLGPRFLYSATGPLLLLSARGLLALRDRASQLANRRLPVTTLVLALLYAAVVTWPTLAAYYSRNYRDTNADVGRAVDRAIDRGELGRAIVFVPPFHYASVFARNAPLLDSEVIFANDLGYQQNLEAMARHPGRAAFKLHCLEEYEVHPYPSAVETMECVYALSPDRPLTIEAVTSQAAVLSVDFATSIKTGDHGSGWKNHDHLIAFPREADQEVGLAFEATRREDRPATLTLTRGPECGIVEVFLDDQPLREIDLYAPRFAVERVRFDRLAVKRGLNVMKIRVKGQNPAASGFAFGLDALTIERTPAAR